MGNKALSSCCKQSSDSSSVKLILWEGTTRILPAGNRKLIAGQIMFENPDKMVCPADSFFIGHPVPALAIDDELEPGQTYFVLPIDHFACSVLSASSIATLSSSPQGSPISFGDSPFEYIRGANGRALIRVMPEFIAKLIVNKGGEESAGSISPSSSSSFLCSTPELKKHYEQLVRSKDQTWSPKLETISEYKVRYSPCRFIGLEWKQKEPS